MSDRTAFFGETLEAARYRFGDTSTDGGNYIVAEDLDGERVLLQFDYDADEWQYAGDVDMAGGDLNSVGTARVDALEAESVSTDDTHTQTIGGANTHYAADYEGSNPDERLDNALSAASDGSFLFLEPEIYTIDRTFSTQLSIFGGDASANGTAVADDTTWTLDWGFGGSVQGVRLDGRDTEVIINVTGVKWIGGRNNSTCHINITEDDSIISHVSRGDITFESDTSQNIVGLCADVTVTDNGSNTVGDIS